MNTKSGVEGVDGNILLADGSSLARPMARRTTRELVRVANALQMAFAESYISGLEVPDLPLRVLCDAYAHIMLKYFPSLLVPYEWVSQETDNLAEGSRDLMKLQYDLPQQMLNRMLGDGPLIYPKYSMGLWEKGAATLEQDGHSGRRQDPRFWLWLGLRSELHHVEVPERQIHGIEPQP